MDILKLDGHKEKLLSTIFQVLQFVIRGLVSSCQLIFQNFLNCMFNHLSKKKECCVCFLVLFYLYKVIFLHFSLVAISQWWHSKQQLGNANHEERYFCGRAHQ